MMPDDRQLLRQFATERSEPAFSRLVARHLPLVYSTALRQTNGDTHLAQDVAQLVFTDLARKAPSLPENVILVGWLHRATLFAARQILRGERRRQAREQQAVTMNSISSEPENDDWRQIRPLLDDALERLNKTDRDALLLRFFEQQSLAEIGANLGGTEEAARKRIARALEKLRGILRRQGVTTTAAALSMGLPAHAVQAAPAGLATTLAHASFAAVEEGTAFTILKITTATQLKTSFCVLAIVGIIATLVIAHQTSPKTPVASPSQTNGVRCTIDFEGVSFNQALMVYVQVCSVEHIKVHADDSVDSIFKPINLQARNVPASDAIKLLEQAFRKQAGVEITYKSKTEVVLRARERQ